MNFINRLQDYRKRFIRLANKRGWGLPEYFLLIGAVIGLGFITVTPPFQGWDESEHYFRGYQVSDLNIKADPVSAPNASGLYQGSSQGFGGSLPSSVAEASHVLRFGIEASDGTFREEALESVDHNLNAGDRKDVRFDNTAIYSPVGYIGSAIGIGLSKLFDTSPVASLYIARFFHLLVWLGLSYVALRLMPIGRNALFVFMLNPVLLFTASTLSPDAIAAGFMALALALVLKLRTMNQAASHKLVLPLALSIIGLLLIKNIYLPVVALLLMIPSTVISKNIKLAIAGLAIVIFFVWNISVAPMTSTIPNYFNVPEHVDAKDQVLFILHHPLAFVNLLIWNILGPLSVLTPGSYSATMSDNAVPNWVVIFWTLALTLTLMTKDTAKRRIITSIQSKRFRYVSAGLLAAVSLLILLSMYLGWSAVASQSIAGVQGRYFIPISFLLIPIIINGVFVITSKKDIHLKLIYGILPLCLLATVYSLHVRYAIGA